MSVAVDLDGFRLDLQPLPAVVHQVLLACGLGVPRLGEHRLHRLGVVLLSAHDLPRQRQHQVVAVCSQPVLRQLPPDEKLV